MLAQWLPVALVAGAEGLIVAYAGERRFAPGWYALLMGCLPVGMLVGDLLVGRFLRPPTRERLVVPLVALAGLPLIGFAAEPGVGVASCLLLVSGLGYAYGLGLQRPFLDALPQDGRGQAFGLAGSGSMTLQGVGPVCLGAVARSSEPVAQSLWRAARRCSPPAGSSPGTRPPPRSPRRTESPPASEAASSRVLAVANRTR